MELADSAPQAYIPYLTGGGEMGLLSREFNWSETVLGDPSGWSVSLLTIISTILNSRYPMFLWWGPQLIQFYNDAYRPSLGNTGKHEKALGQRGEECWPEIWPVIKPLIDQVMQGGEATWSEDQLIPIYRNGRMEDVYWTFGYSRVNDEAGNPGGVLVICNETTEKVKSLQLIEDGAEQQRVLNDELTASNLLMTLANKKLAQQHEELAVAHESIRKSVFELAKSESRFRSIIRQAPVAIAIFKGPTFIVEEFNESVLEYWGRTAEEVRDKPLFDALPEATGQGFEELLENVYTTGERFVARELPVNLMRNGKLEPTLINFIYDPVRDAKGEIEGIIVVCNEVTELINANRALGMAYEQGQLAKEAAEIGTFDMDLVKGTMEWDERCRSLFGISHSDIVTYEQDFLAVLHPDDRDRVADIVQKVLVKSASNGDYVAEYRTIGKEDKKLRWVKAIGKAYFDDEDHPTRFIGSALDITEQKQNELRKNDFIGMVSHELKTPITSLMAIVQMVQIRTESDSDPAVINLLGRAIKQLKKMNALINSFLNVAQLESGKIHLHKQKFNLDELIAEITEDVTVTVAGDRLTFLPCESVMISADRDKIGTVISNLLSNAVKYSPSGSAIVIKCKVDDGMVCVSIKDEGVGISTQNIGKLFDRFYRVEGNYTVAGFGIGLYLCAEIIQRHKGRIWAESEKDKGSTFFFELPAYNA